VQTDLEEDLPSRGSFLERMRALRSMTGAYKHPVVGEVMDREVSTSSSSESDSGEVKVERIGWRGEERK
jgi:hypothetical protein